MFVHQSVAVGQVERAEQCWVTVSCVVPLGAYSSGVINADENVTGRIALMKFDKFRI